jgi:predicted CopG family antitoxin
MKLFSDFIQNLIEIKKNKELIKNLKNIINILLIG